MVCIHIAAMWLHQTNVIVVIIIIIITEIFEQSPFTLSLVQLGYHLNNKITKYSVTQDIHPCPV